jgi:hypothetical protein
MVLDHSKDQEGLVKPAVAAARDGYGTAWMRHTAETFGDFGGDMRRFVVVEALCLVLLGVGWWFGRFRDQPGGMPGMGHRELAQTMRYLPGLYADRVSSRMLQRVTGAASAGQLEKAVELLIRSLHAREEPVTVQERDELRAVLEAMNMPEDRIDGLSLQR